MHLRCLDDERLAVKEEGLVAHGEVGGPHGLGYEEHAGHHNRQ